MNIKRLPLSENLLAFAAWVQERASANDTFKVPRFVVGPSAYNFMLWHLCGVYDATGAVRKELEAFIDVCCPTQGLVAKECLVCVAGPGQNGRPFQYNHFLPDAVRTHLVLTGAGTLQHRTAKIDYTAGDVFQVESELLGSEMSSSGLKRYSTHVVVMWTDAGAGPIWEAYAQANAISVEAQLKSQEKR